MKQKTVNRHVYLASRGFNHTNDPQRKRHHEIPFSHQQEYVHNDKQARKHKLFDKPAYLSSSSILLNQFDVMSRYTAFPVCTPWVRFDPRLPLLAPHHLVHHAGVALNDLDHLGGHVLVGIVGDRGLRQAPLLVERHGCMDGL